MKIDIDKLLAVISATAQAIEPRTHDLIVAGGAVVDFVKSIAPTLSADDQAKLQAALPELLEKMNADVDQAIVDLGAKP